MKLKDQASENNNYNNAGIRAEAVGEGVKSVAIRAGVAGRGAAYAGRIALLAVMVVIFAAFCIAFAGCGDRGSEYYSEADVTRIHNGYGTIFVSGRRIERKADASTSTVVDWRREKVARAGKSLKVKEIDGIVYEDSRFTDGKDRGEPFQLKLNLKMNGEAKGPQPVVLFVPGGGFITCEIDRKYYNVHRYLVENGYAVAVMEYHVIGQGTYRDAVGDVRAAIKWLKEKGAGYGLDVSGGIFLVGNSGGGYVASLAACEDPADIRCVVNFYGLSDIANNKSDYEKEAIRAHHTPRSSDSQFTYGVYSGKALGDDPKRDRQADPVSYVDGDEPPFLHFHGDADLWVSPSQSLHLHEALLKQERPSTRYLLKGEGHGARGFRTFKALDTAIAFMNLYRR